MHDKQPCVYILASKQNSDAQAPSFLRKQESIEGT